MPLQPGSRLGHYEILASLGAGGMGEVYRARDTKLGREVAIKVLLEEVAHDPERLARFEREARVLASLNHPNVATLHGFERDGETSFLVMELVLGNTLADRIARGPIPFEVVIPLFLQIADGLEAAHQRGIIHRDLKPANVKLGADGGVAMTDNARVKILDFGLAKALLPDLTASNPEASHSPTLTLAATQRGEILGTAAYMSPEQARGLPVDERTDIWAFGVCLLEALRGKRVFTGEDASVTLAAVLKDEPDLEELPAAVPPALRRLLTRCLAKDPRHRLRHIADARLELEAADRGDSEPATTHDDRSAARGRRWPWALAAAAAGALLAWWLSDVLRQAPEPAVERVAALLPGDPPPGERPDVDVLAIAPDGSGFAYRARPDRATRGIYYRRFGDEEGRLLFSTATDVSSPFFAPDGRELGFSSREAPNSWRRVPVVGGPASSWFPSTGTPYGASWAPDGSVYFAENGRDGIWRFQADGQSEAVTRVDASSGEVRHAWPHLAAGGKLLLFSVLRSNEPTEVRVLDLATGTAHSMLRDADRARSLTRGYLAFSRGDSLLAARFDAEEPIIDGSAEVFLDGLAAGPYAARWDVSLEGDLLYLTPPIDDRPLNRLVWVDRDGRSEPLVTPAKTRRYLYPRLSADGRRAAVSVTSEGIGLWRVDLATGTQDQLTRGADVDLYPMWARGDKEVLFSRTTTREVLSLPANGSGPEREIVGRKITATVGEFVAQTLSPDGRFLAGYSVAEQSFDIYLFDAVERQLSPLLREPSINEVNPEISPDGRWIAYQSDGNGLYEIFVQPFPKVGAARDTVSRAGGGMQPLWSRRGDELFYVSLDGSLMAVPVDPATGELDEPSEVFGGLQGLRQPFGLADRPGRNYDYDPGSDRFLMPDDLLEEGDEDGRARRGGEVILVRNWVAEVERRLGGD